MSENRQNTSASEVILRSAETANRIKSAVKTGKAVAGAAKGAAVGGPYGAAAVAIWENRALIGKIVLASGLVLMIPILFILMLPSMIFGSLTDTNDIPVMNNDAAIYGNIEAAESAISEIYQESHDKVMATVNDAISELPEGSQSEIIDDYISGYISNSSILISQYCASEDNYQDINVDNMKKKIRKKSDQLFTYSVTSTTKSNGDGTSYTLYTYTISFVGDSIEIFDLSEDQQNLAYDYAENLSLYLYGSFASATGSADVSDEVRAYEPLIIKYAEKHHVSQFTAVISCIMMAESGGRVPDVMQCSECPYNTKYSNAPNSITDPEYSIDVGIKYFAYCLKEAGCKSPTDISKLSLALQGYNYGNGYISWAVDNYGGYSEANAQEFSDMMKQKLGTSGYGNPKYVQAVMKYYTAGTSGGSEGWGSPFVGKDWRSRVTSEYGTRVDPVTHQPGTFHAGIDIGFPKGTPINAVKAGTVVDVQYLSSGYGYNLTIDHGGGFKTQYAHCSAILVRKGQKVNQGDVVAKVGTTGKSTGNHLHLNVYVNGKTQNPRLYIN